MLTCLTNDVQDVSSISNLNFLGTEQKVGDVLTDLIAKLGENIVIKDLPNFQIKMKSIKNIFITLSMKILEK